MHNPSLLEYRSFSLDHVLNQLCEIVKLVETNELLTNIEREKYLDIIRAQLTGYLY
ncbi:putative phage abortive infection protein [Paenibacillus sp. NPDC057934]|uniref:putative phage abortive infection protein n=1 Tax=Paenibacillus sp. NPDC057934 TaxID=3346282 RepID=UPI0036DA45B8